MGAEKGTEPNSYFPFPLPACPGEQMLRQLKPQHRGHGEIGVHQTGCPLTLLGRVHEAGMSGMEATSLYPQLGRQALCFQLENPVLGSQQGGMQ